MKRNTPMRCLWVGFHCLTFVMVLALCAAVFLSGGHAEAQQAAAEAGRMISPDRTSAWSVRAEAEALTWSMTSWEFGQRKGDASEAGGQAGETAEQIFATLLLGGTESSDQTEWAALDRETVGLSLRLDLWEDGAADLLQGLELGLFPFADVPELRLSALVTRSFWVRLSAGADSLGATSAPEASGALSNKDTERSRSSWTAGLHAGYALAVGQTVLEPRMAISYLQRARQDVYRSTVGAVPVEIAQKSTIEKISAEMELHLCYYNCSGSGLSLATSIGFRVLSAAGQWEEKVPESAENQSTERDATGWSVQASLLSLGVQL